MKRTTPFVVMFVGLLGLWRFAPHARSVDVVGLFASGAAFGAGLIRLVVRPGGARERGEP